ncbi:hypothetical protein LC593_21100 [Nostoc sp. CHAB 5844]|nr:hypothetical protein [Nostoc sp. CHAB 5844]
MGLILPLAAFGLSIGDRLDSVRAYSNILIRKRISTILVLAVRPLPW